MPESTSIWFRPLDPRWHGTPKLIFKLILTKNALYALFILLFITELSLLYKWLGSLNGAESYPRGQPMMRYLAPSVVPEMLHTALQTYFVYADEYTPSFALLSNGVFCGLWTVGAIANVAFTRSWVPDFRHFIAWERICYAEAGLQGVIALLYGGCVVCAWMAVRREERARRQARRMWLAGDYGEGASNASYPRRRREEREEEEDADSMSRQPMLSESEGREEEDDAA